MPIEYLTTESLAALVRVCQGEVTRLESAYGNVAFNET